MSGPKYDPDILERRAKRRKKKRRADFLAVVRFLLFVAGVIAVGMLLIRRANPRLVTMTATVTIDMASFERTYDSIFVTPTGTMTPTVTPTQPTPTASSTMTATATVTPTATVTSTPRLSTRTPSSNAVPTGTPLMLLAAAETEIVRTQSGEAPGATGTPLPEIQYAVVGYPGAMNADVVYPNSQCSWMGVAGIVTDLRGEPMTGLFVRVGGFTNGIEGEPEGENAIENVGDQGDVRETMTGLFEIYGPSGYEITLARPVQAIPGPLWIQLYNEAREPISEKVYFEPSERCDRSLILINFQKVAGRKSAP